MPVLKPPKPGGNGTKAGTKEEVWTVVLKPGEVINVEYTK